MVSIDCEQRNAVIVFTHRFNEYWPGVCGEDGRNRAPSCSNTDGKIGLWAENGEASSCETCPFNQYGSAADIQGTACYSMRPLLSHDGRFRSFPCGRSSILDPRFYLVDGDSRRGNPLYQRKGEPQPRKDWGHTGNHRLWKVTIAKTGLLAPSEAAKAMEMRSQIKARFLETITTPAREAMS